ncbi:MAG: hypothetical protein U1D30_18810 [Planctomycetota bacterium]
MADLASYLSKLKTKENAPSVINIEDPHVVAKGRELIAKKRCANCHSMVGAVATARLPWRKERSSAAIGRPGCLGEPDPSKDRPGFHFTNEESHAVLGFLDSLPDEKTTLGPTVLGERILEENNCLACHRRGNEQGLLDVVAQLGITDAKKRAALVPPALTSVGDKLSLEWLVDAVQGKAPRLRPWISPRMPRFRHSKEDLHALVTYFERHDRQVEEGTPVSSADDLASQEMLFAAHRLVGGNGFGCMSCHSIGDYQPAEVEPGARGADLKMLGQRMRPSWFRRWTRDPSRIVPGSEMPSITLAVPGVLDGNVDRQLEALWHGLNSKALTLPTTDAVQTLAANPNEPVIILRDVFEHGEKEHTSRSFGVGLANGHNILLDLDRFSIRRWWVGDFARQKTRGKTWYWESAGPVLLDVNDGLPLFALRSTDESDSFLEPESRGQAVGTLRSFTRGKESADLAYGLDFANHGTWLTNVRLKSDPSGILLGVQVTRSDINVGETPPTGVVPVVRFHVPAELSKLRDSEVEFTSNSGLSRCSVVEAGGPLEFIASRRDEKYGQVVLPLNKGASGWRGELLLATAAKPPVAPVRPRLPEIPRKARVLPSVPGYEVTRLPGRRGPRCRRLLPGASPMEP